MESIWINIQSKIEPILTYSGEIWDPNKGQITELNGIMDKIIKRILKVPPGTPREAQYIETGLLDPETIIKKNTVNMELSIQRNGSTLVNRVINTNIKIAHWADEFSKNVFGEMLLIICNKIMYGYIVNATIK